MHWYIKRKKSLEYKKWENDPLSGETECQRVVKLDGVQWTRSETNGAESFERCPATERKAIRWEASRRKTRPGRLTKPAVKICKSIMVERSRITLKKVHWRMKRRTKLLKPWKKKSKASLHHSCKLPNKERHKYCPPNSCSVLTRKVADSRKQEQPSWSCLPRCWTHRAQLLNWIFWRGFKLLASFFHQMFLVHVVINTGWMIYFFVKQNLFYILVTTIPFFLFWFPWQDGWQFWHSKSLILQFLIRCTGCYCSFYQILLCSLPVKLGNRVLWYA